MKKGRETAGRKFYNRSSFGYEEDLNYKYDKFQL